MKTAETWFEEYGDSHQNPTNKLIHWICVPTIFFCTVGLLWAIPSEYFGNPWLNWATIAAVVSLLFYLRLSFTIFLGMLVVSGLSLWGSYLIGLAGTQVLAISCAAVFFIAWVGQFVGHKIEGKKPSFFQDLQFLLIGPAWLLHFLYKKVGVPY